MFKLSAFLPTFVVLGSVATGVKERQSTVGAVARQTNASVAEQNAVGSVAEPNTVVEVKLVPEQQGLEYEEKTV